MDTLITLINDGLKVLEQNTWKEHPQSVQMDTWWICWVCRADKPNHLTNCSIWLWKEKVKKYLKENIND